MLTGSPPFRSDTWMTLLVLILTTSPAPPRQIVPAIARDIETVCLKCLAKSPEDRYQSAAELAEDLTRVIDGYSPRAIPAEGPSQALGPAPSSKSPLTVTKATPPIEPRPPSTRYWWPFARSRK
jgi:serine/threonine protein kinase